MMTECPHCLPLLLNLPSLGQKQSSRYFSWMVANYNAIERFRNYNSFQHICLNSVGWMNLTLIKQTIKTHSAVMKQTLEWCSSRFFIFLCLTDSFFLFFFLDCFYYMVFSSKLFNSFWWRELIIIQHFLLYRIPTYSSIKSHNSSITHQRDCKVWNTIMQI